jgi:hypothetical protein
MRSIQGRSATNSRRLKEMLTDFVMWLTACIINRKAFRRRTTNRAGSRSFQVRFVAKEWTSGRGEQQLAKSSGSKLVVKIVVQEKVKARGSASGGSPGEARLFAWSTVVVVLVEDDYKGQRRQEHTARY